MFVLVPRLLVVAGSSSLQPHHQRRLFWLLMEALPPPPTDSTRRRSSDSSSPEFEFWMMGNHPSLPDDPDSLTADELFVDGVLLPLHLLSLSLSLPRPQPQPHHIEPPQPLEPSASICSTATNPTPSSGSKRWKDIFKAKPDGIKEKKKNDRKSSSAELNINIWPFSRSRSAGNAGGRPRPAASASSCRKASSAPCSRSNSRGESSKPAGPGSARRWAASPGRAGVHLSRSSPVWQLRRTTKVGEPTSATKERAGGRRRASSGARVLSLNVNTCIGYRNQMSCGDDDGAAAGGGDRAGGNGSLFSLRTLFSKKVY